MILLQISSVWRFLSLGMSSIHITTQVKIVLLIDNDGKRYPKDGGYVQSYIEREYTNTGFEYAVGNVRLHPQNKCLIGNLMVDRALYNRIMQIIKPEDWVVAGTEKG